MFWKETFLAARRAEWLAQVTKVQYCINGTWQDAEIVDKTISGDTLHIKARLDGIEATVKITAIRIIDSNGEVAGEQSENFSITAFQGLISLWDFSIYETA